jgi:type IV secretion system protein TrbL
VKKTLVILALICLALPAHAEVSGPAALNGLFHVYQGAAGGWQATMLNAAQSIFWKLALISFVWTFCTLLLRRAELGEMSAELVRYIVFTGFGWWILVNGPGFGRAIIDTFAQLGGRASGLPDGLSPAVIGNIGMDLYQRITTQVSWFTPGAAFISVLLAVGVLILSAVIACNILLVLASAWILLYAGIVFLGFGGGRWTSEFALGYYRSLLGVGARVMTMELIIGLSVKFLQGMVGQVNQSPNGQDVAAIVFAMIILWIISDKVPSMVGGIISGGHGSHHGLGLLGMASLVTSIQMASRAISNAAAAGGGSGALETAIRSGERLASASTNGEKRS